MTESVLTYVGTILIALEFVRGAKLPKGFKHLQALVAMLFAWPFKPYLNAMSKSKSSKIQLKVRRTKAILLLTYALLFLLIMIPITVIFYLMYFSFVPFEAIHTLVNRLYLVVMKEYQPTYRFWTGFTIRSSEQYKNIKDRQVIKELQKGEIPVLPIAGVILLTIALFMQIL